MSSESKPDEYDNPIMVINWIKNMSERTEFFNKVSVIPFCDMCFIYPKDMGKDKAIEMLKKYWGIYSS